MCGGVNQIFDIVLIFNSIHYSAVTETKWINLIEEISKRTKFNSKVYINYLDSNLLNTILDKQIVNNCNYVKKIDPPDNSLPGMRVNISPQCTVCVRSLAAWAGRRGSF